MKQILHVLFQIYYTLIKMTTNIDEFWAQVMDRTDPYTNSINSKVEPQDFLNPDTWQRS